MNGEIVKLKDKAEKAKVLYNRNLITRGEAYNEIMPYINACNKRSREIAMKHGIRPKFMNINSYLR